MGISLNPENFPEGGGLLDDADVTVESASFVMYDYGGKSPVEVPALKLVLVAGAEDKHDSYWSCGSKDDWQPENGGKGLKPIGKATSITLSSNCGVFLRELVAAGFPTDKLDAGDITILEGMECHVQRIPAPKRAGLKSSSSDRDPTVLVVKGINKLPWEKGGRKGKAEGKGTTKSKGSTGSNGDALNGRAAEALIGMLAENPDGIKKAEIPKLAMTALKGDSDRNALIKVLYDAAFLETQDGWAFDSGTGMITLGD